MGASFKSGSKSVAAETGETGASPDMLAAATSALASRSRPPVTPTSLVSRPSARRAHAGQRALGGPNVANIGTDEPVRGGLFKYVRSPAGVSRQRERGREEIGREAN